MPGFRPSLLEGHDRAGRFDNGRTLAFPVNPLQPHFLHAGKMAEERQGQAVDCARLVTLKRMGHVKLGMVTIVLLLRCRFMIVSMSMARMFFRQRSLDRRGGRLAACSPGQCQQIAGLPQLADCIIEGLSFLIR